MARSFNGTSDVIVVASAVGSGNALLSTSARTTALWCLATSTPSFAYAFSINDTGANDAFWDMGQITGGWGGFIRTSFTDTLQTNIAVTTNVWHHIAMTYTLAGSVGGIFYLDGVNKATTGADNTAINVTASNTASIGRDGDAGNTNFWPGYVADVGHWNVALTAAEVAALANGARPGMIRPLSLTGWWPLPGLSSPEPDLSGNAFNGTLTGTQQANSGPPIMQFTPRWPQRAAEAAAGGTTLILPPDYFTTSFTDGVEILAY